MAGIGFERSIARLDRAIVRRKPGRREEWSYVLLHQEVQIVLGDEAAEGHVIRRWGESAVLYVDAGKQGVTGGAFATAIEEKKIVVAGGGRYRARCRCLPVDVGFPLSFGEGFQMKRFAGKFFAVVALAAAVGGAMPVRAGEESLGQTGGRFRVKAAEG